MALVTRTIQKMVTGKAQAPARPGREGDADDVDLHAGVKDDHGGRDLADELGECSGTLEVVVNTEGENEASAADQRDDQAALREEGGGDVVVPEGERQDGHRERDGDRDSAQSGDGFAVNLSTFRLIVELPANSQVPDQPGEGDPEEEGECESNQEGTHWSFTPFVALRGGHRRSSCSRSSSSSRSLYDGCRAC